MVIPGRNTKNGTTDGIKGSLNKNTANNWLLISYNNRPT